MNNEANRAAIAAALDTVTGVKGYVRRPKAPKAGDGWPLWRGAERSDGFTFAQTFTVVVALPGDEAQADINSDTLAPLLAEALEEKAMWVESIVPAVLASDSGDMNALMITGRVE